jgi:PPOX class probable F420-dependent enzyme
MGRLTMTKTEREAFLAGVHIGVVAIAAGDRAPLAGPVWYAYEPGGEVRFTIDRNSVKARRLERAGRASLCAQTETPPTYQYVTVEGPATVEPGFDPDERRAVARRYLGDELGDAYIEDTQAESARIVTVRLRPERWLSVDYGKFFD